MSKRPTITMAEAKRIGYPFDGSMNVLPDPELIVVSSKKGDASFGTSTTQLRVAKATAKNEERESEIRLAQRLKTEEAMSNAAIAERMGKDETYIRNLLVD